MRQALCDRVDGTRHVAMLDDRSRRAAGGSGWLSHVRLFSVSVVPANVTDVMTPDVSGNEHTCFPTSYEIVIQTFREMPGRAARCTWAAQAKRTVQSGPKVRCCIAGCNFVNYAPV